MDILEEGAQKLPKSKATASERVSFENLISDISARFINVPPGKVDAEIERALAQLREFFHMDQWGLIEVSPTGSARLTHASHAEGTSAPSKIADLPPDFAQIPPDSPAARVLVSVPGTEEAKDAVLLAQIPTTIEVDPVKAAAQAKVSYSGTPEFKPIEGTSLSYATNTTDKVVKVGDVYCLCLQGVWFMSTTPEGPWKTASSIPKEVYTIPPSSPVYNVTYVTQTTTPSGTVQSSYTAGYMGAFVVGVTVGAVICGGTGYCYPPYYYRPPYGYPIYYPHPPAYGWAAYNPHSQWRRL